MLICYVLQNHEAEFPVLARMARDILAAPGVSVAVEQLFSQCKTTLTDKRSSMSPQTVSKTIVTKMALRTEKYDEVHYLKG